MISSFYGMFQMYGAELWFFGCIVCLIFAFLIAFSKEENGGKNSKRTALWIVVPAAICDIIWFIVIFPKGDYVNQGIGGAYAFLALSIMYPLALAIGVAAASEINSRKE